MVLVTAPRFKVGRLDAYEEKRMVVILDEAEFDAWLDCPPERMKDFMRPYLTDRLEAKAAPKPG